MGLALAKEIGTWHDPTEAALGDGNRSLRRWNQPVGHRTKQEIGGGDMKGHQELKPVEGLTRVDEEGFRKAVERAQNKKLICWISSGVMGSSILPENLDIGVFLVMDQGRIAAEKGLSRKLIEVAEAAGYSPEICSYHKVTIGYALLLARGQLDLVPEVPTMLRPDFIWAHNGCPSVLWAGEALGRILEVPVIGFDLPFEYDIVNRETVLDYVESQLREALDILETWVGRPLDWPRLAEHIMGLAELAELHNGINEACKTCPSVSSTLDIIPATAVHRAGLVEASKRTYGALREEIHRKIATGQTDVPDERIRIMWAGGSFPWGKTEAIRDLLAHHGATLCSSLLATGGPSARGEGLDPGDPLRTAAWLNQHRLTNQPIDTRIEDYIKPGIDGYNIDGVIFHMARTCKINGIPMLVMVAEVEKKLGVSTLILESDAVDPAFFSQTQAEDRIESFLESIAARKAGV